MKKLMKGFAVIMILSLGLMSLTACTEGNNTGALAENAVNYIDPSYIVEVDWLKENIEKDSMLILDTRPAEDYSKGHIPGAVNVAWQSFANMEGKPGDKGWGVILDSEALAKAFANVGVDKNKTVIVYGDTINGWGEDGRFLWMLRMAGLEDSKILNGGFNLWKTKGYETTKDIHIPKKTELTIEKLNDRLTVDTNWIKENLQSAKIIDSRSKEEYDGAVKFGEARGGHIPGAIHMPYRNLLNEDGTLKNQEELQIIFKEAGIDKEDEIAVYCTAGIRSSHLTMVLKLAGYTKAKNYDESFYTWSADESLELK